VAAAALVLTGLAAGAPHALRRLDGFRVATVEVRGTRLMEPASALAALALPAGATVFDDFEPWRRRLLAHPLVAAARIARRLPDTVVLEITETEPLALVRTPELRPVDERGRVLPVAPGTAPLDLPVLGGRADIDDTGRVADEAQRALLTTLATVRTAEPAIAEWVSEVTAAGPDGVRLLLRWPEHAEILLPRSPDAARLAQLALVLADLAATPDAGVKDTVSHMEISRLRRLDARYRDQVVVSLAGGTPSRAPSRKER
jgi:hypothetical protein